MWLFSLQSGATPLHGAAMQGHVPVIALLLATPDVDPLSLCVRVAEAGANRDIGLPACPPSHLPAYPTQRGETPLEWAEAFGRDAAAVALQADPRVAATLAADNNDDVEEA